MRFLRGLLARMTGVFTKDSADEDLRAELQAHIEMETAENVRRGMIPEEARRHAALASGGLTQATEAVRDQRGLPWLEGIAADIKYAVRSLRHSRAFAVVVIVTLALGIGANTAIFSVVRGVLLKPLPHRDGDRLVYLRQSSDGPGQKDLDFSVPEVKDLRAGVPALSGIAEYSSWSAVHRSDAGAERIDIGLITGNYFEIMGLSAELGRLTRPSDDGPGVPVVVVLTHEYWVNHFGADSSVIGKQMRLDNKLGTIIGVLQPAPFFPERIDALTNMVMSEHHLGASMVTNRSHRMTQVVARLAPGKTMEQARTEVGAVFTRLHGEFKDAYNPALHYTVAVIPFKDALSERAKMTVWLLMAAAAFVLVIAVANVANLTLMRGVRREHELVVRAALGAGVARLRRLLLVENLVLATIGALFGVGIAFGGVRLLTSLASRYSPRANEIHLDGTVLGFTVSLAVAVALILSFLGTLPREGGLAAWILGGAQRMSGGLRKQRLQRGLVVVQVAVSVVLLAGAGLLTRTLMRLSEVHTGLRTEEVLSMEVNLVTPNEIFANPSAVGQAFGRYDQMLREVKALPGVLDAGIGSPGPLRTSGVLFELKAESKSLAAGETWPSAEVRTANPDFFSAAGIPLIAGRAFAATDGPTSGKVVIINKTLADRFFPNQDPIGQRVAWTGEVLKFTPITGDWRTIVGVVANTKDGGPDALPRTSVYLPFAQFIPISGDIVIRVDSNAAGFIPATTRIVRRLAPTTPIERVSTIAQLKAERVAPRRLNATLVSSFGILAVIIAAVGIAGVLAFSVSARTNEIGIRMSLGADRGRVQRMILREGGVLLLIGLVLGVGGAFFASSVIREMLFGVPPHDPVTYIGVAILMLVIGVLACWIPAIRAARIDPAITMRQA